MKPYMHISGEAPNGQPPGSSLDLSPSIDPGSLQAQSHAYSPHFNNESYPLKAHTVAQRSIEKEFYANSRQPHHQSTAHSPHLGAHDYSLNQSSQNQDLNEVAERTSPPTQLQAHSLAHESSFQNVGRPESSQNEGGIGTNATVGTVGAIGHGQEQQVHYQPSVGLPYASAYAREVYGVPPREGARGIDIHQQSAYSYEPNQEPFIEDSAVPGSSFADAPPLGGHHSLPHHGYRPIAPMKKTIIPVHPDAHFLIPTTSSLVRERENSFQKREIEKRQHLEKAKRQRSQERPRSCENRSRSRERILPKPEIDQFKRSHLQRNDNSDLFPASNTQSFSRGQLFRNQKVEQRQSSSEQRKARQNTRDGTPPSDSKSGLYRAGRVYDSQSQLEIGDHVKILQNAISTLADSVRDDLLMIKRQVIPGIEHKLQHQFTSLSYDTEIHRNQLTKQVIEVEKRLELAMQKDEIRYKTFLEDHQKDKVSFESKVKEALRPMLTDVSSALENCHNEIKVLKGMPSSSRKELVSSARAQQLYEDLARFRQKEESRHGPSFSATSKMEDQFAKLLEQVKKQEKPPSDSGSLSRLQSQMQIVDKQLQLIMTDMRNSDKQAALFQERLAHLSNVIASLEPIANFHKQHAAKEGEEKSGGLKAQVDRVEQRLSGMLEEVKKQAELGHRVSSIEDLCQHLRTDLFSAIQEVDRAGTQRHAELQRLIEDSANKSEDPEQDHNEIVDAAGGSGSNS